MAKVDLVVNKILEGANVRSVLAESVIPDLKVGGEDMSGNVPGREICFACYAAETETPRYNYYYYHHGKISVEDRKKIADCIVRNDYEGFKKIQQYYNVEHNPRGWQFLPDRIFDAKLGKDIPLTKSNFGKIGFVEYECG